MSDISDMMYEQGFHDGYQQALSELNDKQFEKVVRCKDCRFAHLTYDGMCKQCEQIMDDEDNMLTLYLPVGFYCAFGEPREGGQE